MNVDGGRGRRLVQRSALALGTVALVWFLVLVLAGGVDTSFLGIRLRSNNPLRLLLASAVAFATYLLAGGNSQPLVNLLRRFIDFLERSLIHRPRSRRLAVAALALGLGFYGYFYGTKVASGSDSWGYLSATELMLAGNLKVDVSFAKDAPWPYARRSFAPLGFRPAVSEIDWSLVPTYSLGLPALLAIAKKIAGHQAMFWVVPLTGALLVVATFGIGMRMASPGAAVVGAWLVATSPTVLFMIVSPMSDLPAAAFWATGFYFLLGRSATAVLVSALAASVAIVIRPNLVPLAGVMGLYLVLRRHQSRRTTLVHALIFVAGLLPAIGAVAWFNNRLYGSPLASGYGTLSEFLDPSNIAPNLRLYLGWLIETQTWIVLAGFVAIAVPSRKLWPAAPDRRTIAAMAAFVGTVWASYLLYVVFDAWWYLRFLVASFPFVLLGVGAVAAWLVRDRPLGMRLAASVTVFVLGLAGVRLAVDRGATRLWEGERRYIAVAQMAKRLTSDNSVILSAQHSGSLRYYAGRMTMRYDEFEPEWIDRAIDWLAARGVSTYFAVEAWELAEVRQRFAGTRAADALKQAPLAIYTPGPFALFSMDVEARRGAEVTERVTGVDRRLRAVLPEPPPRLALPH